MVIIFFGECDCDRGARREYVLDILCFRDKMFYYSKSSILSFRNSYTYGIAEGAFMKGDSRHEDIVRFGVSSDLESVSRFCDDTKGCFIGNLFDNFVGNLAIWMHDCFESTPLDE